MGKYNNNFLIKFINRIIKIWDKETLLLQASLHGHKDMIIDIQVSKCNRYMASASNDGVIIIWDLKEFKILH